MRKAAAAGIVGIALLTGCAGAQVQFTSYIDDAGGQLRGHVVSTRTETGSYWFEWGRTPALGKQSAVRAVDFVAGERKFVDYNLNNREPDTTYYWRLCAEDQDPQQSAPGCSELDSFTTNPTPPGRALTVGGGWWPFHNARDGSLNEEGPLTFEGPAVLTLLDSYCASDRFRVFDNGIKIGRTNRVAERPGCAPYRLYLEESLADTEYYSRGSFPLGPGPHSIRVLLVAGEGNRLDNSGYVRVDPLSP